VHCVPGVRQYDEGRLGEKMPYSRVAVGDTESRQLTKMGPTSYYVTKATYSRVSS